ncbi:MAG TPA: ROK family protein [Chitinophagaceae bacterium]|nr:ROK family protein [Chitinophagaceae bacterium]
MPFTFYTVFDQLVSHRPDIHALINEIICHCWKKGCLETEASGQALVRSFIQKPKEVASSMSNDTQLKKSMLGEEAGIIGGRLLVPYRLLALK